MPSADRLTGCAGGLGAPRRGFVKSAAGYAKSGRQIVNRRGPSMKRRLLAAGVAVLVLAGGGALWSRQHARGYP